VVNLKLIISPCNGTMTEHGVQTPRDGQAEFLGVDDETVNRQQELAETTSMTPTPGFPGKPLRIKCAQALRPTRRCKTLNLGGRSGQKPALTL